MSAAVMPSINAVTTTAPIAPRWHTAILVGLYLSVAVTGTLMSRHGASASALPGAHPRLVAVYLPMLVVQWGIVVYVSRVGRPRSALRALLGAPWTTARRAVVDLALAFVGWMFIKLAEVVWTHLTAIATAPSVTTLLPHTASERLAWVLVAASVGFCEEVVFRGYLLTQFAAFTRRAGLAVVLQALLFGLAHAEQGPTAIARVALYGLGFGALARWRRSLLPGVACHVWTDLASGLLRL